MNKLSYLLVIFVTAMLFLACSKDNVTKPDLTGEETIISAEIDSTDPTRTTAPIIRGRVGHNSNTALTKRAGYLTGSTAEPDQVWIIPIYERRGGFEDGLSFMSLSFTTIIPLDSNSNFSYAYADQNAPEGVPVIDAYVPLYGHYGDDHSAFTGNILMILANSQKASSMDLQDRKEAIIGFVSLDAAQSNATLVGIPISTIIAESDIDLGEIETDSQSDEAFTQTPLTEVEEYFELNMSQLLAMAQTDNMLKAIANQFVNSKLVPNSDFSDSTHSYLHEEEVTDTDDYTWWREGLTFVWTAEDMFRSQASNLPSDPYTWDSEALNFIENDSKNQISSENPVVLRLERTTWNPNIDFERMIYTGYSPTFSTSEILNDVSVENPSLADITDLVVRYDRGIYFERENWQGYNSYFPPVPGQPHVAPGWWDIYSNGEIAASFQMSLANPFDNQNNVIVPVPRVEIVLQDTLLVADLWQWNSEFLWNSGNISDGETIIPNAINSIDTGKTWIDLQKIVALNINWYYYSNGSYVPIEPDVMSMGLVGIDIATRSPRRFESYTHNSSDGWPQGDGTAITPDNEFYYTLGHGESDNIHLNLEQDINLMIPYDSDYYIGDLLRGANSEYYIGEVVDGEYWESFANWALITAIHIDYSFNGVYFQFSFNNPR